MLIKSVELSLQVRTLLLGTNFIKDEYKSKLNVQSSHFREVILYLPVDVKDKSILHFS